MGTDQIYKKWPENGQKMAKMLHAQINGVIANIESLGADAEQIDHPTLLYG